MKNTKNSIPLVSVYWISMYRSDYLIESVKSFLKSTNYPKLELIVIDCSTGKEGILHRKKIKSSNYFNKKIFRKDWFCTWGNANYGFEESSGDFIIHLEDDSLFIEGLPKNWLEYEIDNMSKNKIDAINFFGSPKLPSSVGFLCSRKARQLWHPWDSYPINFDSISKSQRYGDRIRANKFFQLNLKCDSRDYLLTSLKAPTLNLNKLNIISKIDFSELDKMARSGLRLNRSLKYNYVNFEKYKSINGYLGCDWNIDESSKITLSEKYIINKNNFLKKERSFSKRIIIKNIIKNILKKILLNKFLLYLINRIYLIIEKILPKNEIDKIILPTITNIGDKEYIIKKFYLNYSLSSKEHEPHIKLIIVKLNKIIGKNTFVDVGANVGQTLIKILYANPDANYVGFEPMFDSFYFVKRFIEDNKIINAKILPFALSNNEKPINIYYKSSTDDTAITNQLLYFKNKKFDIKNHKIFPFKGDSIMSNLNIKKTGLIKIDVEGNEFNVMQGFEKTLKNDKPFLIFECLPNSKIDKSISKKELKLSCNIKRNNARLIYNFLNNLSYKMGIIYANGLVAKINEINLDEPNKNFGRRDYFAWHSKREAELNFII
jgi:FkbM family methyltransferase